MLFKQNEKKLLSLIFVCLIIEGGIVCNKPIKNITEPAVQEYTTYTIEKGQQFCTPNPQVVTTDSELNFIAVFDSSCIYTTSDPSNQDDINKLYGFSDCNTPHLENSARIGWRWSNDSLRIFAYVHNNGNIIFKEITTAEIGETILCRITCLEGQYSFTANGKNATLPRNCSGQHNRYKLYPYFGGNETAPHTIEIKIKDL